MPMAPGPRRNCYTICRPWYCAGVMFPLTRPRCCRGCGDRGCLTGDHLTIDVLRYPGSDFRPGDPDGAWLLRSSLWDQLLAKRGTAYLLVMRTLSVACDSATLRQPAPSPVLRLLWLGTPLPKVPVRASAADAFTEVLLTDFAAGYCDLLLRVPPLRYCLRRPLITAGHPVRSPVPSPSCNHLGFGTPPPHRPAHCNCVYYCLPVRFCQALLTSVTRETITTPPPNVYSSQHRFPRVRL